jgi:hypothetical protein
MIDRYGDPGSAGFRHELGRLFDRLVSLIVGLDRSGAAGATGTDDGGARLAEGHRNTATATARGAGDDGYLAL